MSTLNDKEYQYNKSQFIIAVKAEHLIYDINDLLEVIPKKYYYHKNKILSYSYELLDNIYVVNNSKGEIADNMLNIQKDISMIQMLIGYFITKDILSLKQVGKVFKTLTELSKMTYSWFKSKGYNNES